MMRKTKIVCTIGPASESVDKLTQLIENGMNVARLNFSHGDYEEHAARIKNIREVSKELNKTVSILLDLQGPEIRTKSFVGGEAVLNRNEKVRICTREVEGTADHFSVTYKGLIDDIAVGNTISLDDGLIELRVTEVDKEKEEIETIVVNSGIIKNRKGVNIPNVNVNLPSLTEKDEEDIKFGIEQDVDFIAASFVRKHTDVLKIRRLLEENGGEDIEIISKIENQEGVDNIDKIVEASFGIMVARGDLGVEIPPEDVPLVQKDLIHRCNLAGKPVITATQMLDSMQWDPRPTRAEASDVANAILDGTDAIMLSGETAAGDFPVESVKMMDLIALKTESSLDHDLLLKNRTRNVSMTITEAISQSVTHTSANLGVEAIITPTQSGHAARMISKYRPEAPIVAVTFTPNVHRRLTLVWGIHPVLSEQAETTDQLVEYSIDKGLESGLVTRGSQVIITAGVPVGVSGATNLMKVHVIGNVIAKGQGIGRRYAYGEAVIAKNAEDAIARVKEGDILVTRSTDKDMMPAIERAAAVVTEEGGLTSHAAVVGLSLEIPVIVGLEDVYEQVENGEMITVDSGTGEIHRGHASVL